MFDEDEFDSDDFDESTPFDVDEGPPEPRCYNCDGKYPDGDDGYCRRCRHEKHAKLLPSQKYKLPSGQ